MNNKFKVFWVEVYILSACFIYFSIVALGHKCPSGWEEFGYSCYKFASRSKLNRDDAQARCQNYSAELLSVNTYEEHIFISNWLSNNDSYHHKWYTSGIKNMNGFWVWQDSEDVQITNAFFLWLPEEEEVSLNRGSVYAEDEREMKKFLAYNFSITSGHWGVTKVYSSEELRYICEIHKDKLHQIFMMERDLDYGLVMSNKDQVPRGPYIIEEPKETIFDGNGRDAKNGVSLKCVATGYPPPLYKWYRHEDDISSPIYIDPAASDQFSQTDGLLTIFNPSTSLHHGKYSCAAFNKYGLVISQAARLSIEYIGEFYKWRSPEFGKHGWGKAISCDYPYHQKVQNFRWSRNGFPQFVEENGRVFVSKDGNLYFSSLEKADSGNYSCSLGTLSSTGRMGANVTLTVEPPVSGQKLIFPNGFPKSFPSDPEIRDNVTLECVAFGYPTPEYSWSRIHPSKNLPKEAYTMSYNRVLVIPRLKIEDYGVYECTAINMNERINKSVILSAQAFPDFIITLGNQVVDIGAVVKWKCEAFGIPSVTYSWLKNGAILLTKNLSKGDIDRYNIFENTLTIKNVDYSDQGMYQCKVSNILGAAYSTGELKVLKLAPSFQKYPLEVEMYATEGENVTIPCQPEAAPFPKIVWKFNEVLLQLGGRFKMGSNGYLYIRSATINDEGQYTCLALNQYGSAQSSGNLIMLSPPQLYELPPPNVTAVFNDSLELPCQAHVSSLLEVAYVWFHNGLMIDFARVHQFRRNHSGFLTISRISFADAGFYKCVVKTSIGQASASSKVIIVGPPGSPGGVDVEYITTTDGIITWSDGSDNGGQILGYTIEGKTNHNSTWHILIENATHWRRTNVSNRQMLRFYNILSPWSRYNFRVSAINIFGKGNPSEESPIYATTEDKPFVAPSNVGGGGGRLGDLTIKWKSLPPGEWNAPKIWYKIYYKPADAKTKFFGKELRNLGNINMYTVFVGEENYYKQYIVKVQAINNMGIGPVSHEAVIYSAEKAIQIQPSHVMALPFNSTALNVSWNPIKLNQPGGVRGKLIGYRIKYWQKTDIEYNALTLLHRGLTPWGLIVGLLANTEYWVKVMAYNDAGSGIESEPIVGRTFLNAPQRMPTNVKVKAVSSTSIKVTWRGILTSPDEEALEGYKVRCWEDNQDFTKPIDVIKPLDGEDLKATVTDLTPGTVYHLRVLAYSAGGDGRMSYPVIKFSLGDREAMAYTSGTDNNMFNITIFLFGLLFLYVS